jgi:hypothetical protein
MQLVYCGLTVGENDVILKPAGEAPAGPSSPGCPTGPVGQQGSIGPAGEEGPAGASPAGFNMTSFSPTVRPQ